MHLCQDEGNEGTGLPEVGELKINQTTMGKTAELLFPF